MKASRSPDRTRRECSRTQEAKRSPVCSGRNARKLRPTGSPAMPRFCTKRSEARLNGRTSDATTSATSSPLSSIGDVRMPPMASERTVRGPRRLRRCCLRAARIMASVSTAVGISSIAGVAEVAGCSLLDSPSSRNPTRWWTRPPTLRYGTWKSMELTQFPMESRRLVLSIDVESSSLVTLRRADSRKLMRSCSFASSSMKDLPFKVVPVPCINIHASFSTCSFIASSWSKSRTTWHIIPNNDETAER
mmetsp:Transcript_2259/g.6462  ORF Transcript_2259/g.6462 Transcript_2259/m.6462 type:complete len:248 (-) Transcript_2259:851-1594(-)